MPTQRLFDDDPYIRRFTAVVQACEPAPEGWWVTLDRTAFFPEGGGQSPDLGTLGPARVLDVQEQAGQIRHLTDRPVAGTLTGVLDWDRRFDLMQQHSGEHLVSGTVHRLYGYENVGFHLGAELVTIDFDGILTQADLARVEAEVNRAIWADRPTRTRVYPSQADCRETYRSKKEIAGPLRLVEFPEVDVCACCGTHVARAGEIGLVKLLSAVKFHQGVRVELVCGRRAYDYVAAVCAQNRQISGLLSAKPLETAGAVTRLQGELAQRKQTCARWEDRYLGLLAGSLPAGGEVLVHVPELSPDSVRRLCLAAMERTGELCAVLSGSDGAGYAYALGQTGGDLRDRVKAMNRALEGRGGGKPPFAQGTLRADRARIEEYFRNQLPRLTVLWYNQQ